MRRMTTLSTPTPPRAPMPSAFAPTSARGGTVLGWAALCVAFLSAGGVAATTLLQGRWLSTPRSSSDNITYYLYILHERPFFALLGVFALAAWLYVRRVEDRDVAAGVRATASRLRVPVLATHRGLWAATAAVVLLAWGGSYAVLHSLPFSMDEYNAVFQARILAAGRITAPIPQEWRPFAPALTPVFVTYYPDQQAWRSGYMPVYSAIRALFSLAGSGNLTNPILGGLAVLALAAAGRRLWPGNSRRVALAVLFLVTSSQFLFNSMSWYSMPAHLLFNLVWLWLYLRDDTTGLALAPLLGVLALGLHNPFPHALFVAPFLIRMLRRRRFAWLTYMSAVYAAGSLVWLAWLRASASYLAANGGVTGTLALPGFEQLRTQVIELSLVLSWQAPLVVILALVALIRWRELAEPERDVASGLLLTAAFYVFYPQAQGHGWGYRYIYSALGSLMLLAATGADLSARTAGERVRVTRLVAASSLLALLLQWPLRAVQVGRFVRPFARATEYVATRPAAVVVVYPDSSYYGRDLVRNDPFLRNPPRVVSAPQLGDSAMRQLESRFGGQLYRVRPAELARLGIATF